MLDHGIARMLQAMHDDGEPPLFADHDAAVARRRGVEIRGRYYPPVLPRVAAVEETTVPGPAGPIAARIYRPPAPTGVTVVFFHGGGWIIGDLDSHDGHARRLAATVGAVVLHVDYRLAPENPSQRPTWTAWRRSSGPASTSTSSAAGRVAGRGR